jgi:hypothetical protein
MLHKQHAFELKKGGNMLKYKILFCFPFVVAACSVAPSPSVIAFNNVSVTVRDGGLADRNTSLKLSRELAAERCGAVKKSAEYVSTEVFTEGPYDSKQDHLYACR